MNKTLITRFFENLDFVIKQYNTITLNDKQKQKVINMLESLITTIKEDK